MIIEIVTLAGGYLLFRYGLTTDRASFKYTGLVLMSFFAIFSVVIWTLAVNQGIDIKRLASAWRFPLVILVVIAVDYVRLRDKRGYPD